MAISVRVRIQDDTTADQLHDVDAMFLRRTYATVQRISISLTSGTKTEIEHMLNSVAVLYVRRAGDSANVKIYKGASPESWQFDNTWLAIGLSGVAAFYLESDAATTVTVYLAGS